MNLNEILLGSIASFSELPAKLTIQEQPYWLVRTTEGEYHLLLALCPHAGGDILPLNEVLFCPLHFWTFHGESGICLNDPGERLMRRTVEVRQNQLYAVGQDH